jgi:light-regulated signal transduction histidine kinase (bacteriophytochrome)
VLRLEPRASFEMFKEQISTDSLEFTDDDIVKAHISAEKYWGVC